MATRLGSSSRGIAAGPGASTRFRGREKQQRASRLALASGGLTVPPARLLDRLANRMPELNPADQSIEWTTLEDGHQALLVNGGGLDGGNGTYFSNAGEDVHAVGSLAPLAPVIGCLVIQPDGGRRLAHVVPDPLAGQKPD